VRADDVSGERRAFEPMAIEQLRTRRLTRVLDRYAPTVPGCFLYFPRVHVA
jgi:hypothetical protein